MSNGSRIGRPAHLKFSWSISVLRNCRESNQTLEYEREGRRNRDPFELYRFSIIHSILSNKIRTKRFTRIDEEWIVELLYWFQSLSIFSNNKRRKKNESFRTLTLCRMFNSFRAFSKARVNSWTSIWIFSNDTKMFDDEFQEVFQRIFSCLELLFQSLKVLVRNATRLEIDRQLFERWNAAKSNACRVFECRLTVVKTKMNFENETNHLFSRYDFQTWNFETINRPTFTTIHIIAKSQNNLNRDRWFSAFFPLFIFILPRESFGVANFFLTTTTPFERLEVVERCFDEFH